MSDVFLASRLQSAMGDAYRLERELPGGGMSRLFVALESSLNRRVVIKVLPPELTSDVSAQRFKQEIELAAHLQHPHILPILAAGAKDDLLYYVMPYVTGESLRQHIEQSGPMPVADAVRILREVADALAHAHRKGIVHRDIKPENILLEEGHAVLADFGVARAIDEARSGAALPRVTGTGMSVGTPTYMAPEQASGERHIDARADLYALAIVGYEMLAGKLPFSAPSAQAMLAAHLTTPPPPLTKSRPDVPAPVSAAIAKALSKAPDDRYRTAEEFRDALDPAAAGAGGGRRKRTILVAAAAAIVLAAAALVATWRSRPQLDASLVAVAPFGVLGSDKELELWHEGMVDVLSRNLDGVGTLRTVPPSVVVRRWSGRADPASAAQLGRGTGAGYVVFGSLVSGGDSVTATVSVLDVRSGRNVSGDISRRDVPARIDRLADSITFAVVRALSGTEAVTARLSSLGTNSLPALKAYLQGEQYYRRGEWDSTVVADQRALELDSGFALAAHTLGEAYGWVGGSGDTLSDLYLARAGRHNHGLAPRDSLIIAADSLVVALTAPRGDPHDLADRVRMFHILDEAVRRYPDDPAVWYALGDARFHFGYGRVVGVPIEQVFAPFQRSIALDSSFTPAYVHAICLSFGLGGTEAGRRYMDAYFAHHPRGVDSAGIALAQRLTDPSLARSEETKRQLAAASNDALIRAENALYAWADSAEVSVELERMLSPSRRTEFTRYGDSTWQRRRLSNGLARRGHWHEAQSILKRARWDAGVIALAGGLPPDSVWSSFVLQVREQSCPFCFFNYWAARGDTTSIVRASRMMDSAVRRDTFPGAREFRSYLGAMGQAYQLLARHDSAGALRAIIALPDSLCYQCGFIEITQAELQHAAGRDREALATLKSIGADFSLYAILMTLERGRVAEKLGEKEIAVDSYLRVAGMWQNGDPALQPFVAEARAALKRLGGERAQGFDLRGAPSAR